MKMTNERAQAISVANRYFALADGMVPGFMDHLAEHVVLDWFGHKVKGKKNVTTFILSNRTESFHTFSDIIPISGITYEKAWKKEPSLDQNANRCETHASNCFHKVPTRYPHETKKSVTYENVIDFNGVNNADAAFVEEDCNLSRFNIEKHIKTLKISRVRYNKNVDIDENRNEFSEDAFTEMSYQSYDLNKNDLCNLFEPEITSQTIAAKIQNINRVKLKEEMAPTIRAINRECGQGDGPVIAEANATKYLEANGEIKFVRINTQKDSPFLYYWSRNWKKKVWKRRCKLRIAYSLLIDNVSPKINNKYITQKNACSACHSNLSTVVRDNVDKIQKSKLPSVEEAIKVSNKLVRDVNYFGGYLKPLNFLEDRKDFLKSFETEMAQKNPNVHSCAHYVRNKLIIDFPNKKPFNVTYQIHKIVYTIVEKGKPAAQNVADEE